MGLLWTDIERCRRVIVVPSKGGSVSRYEAVALVMGRIPAVASTCVISLSSLVT